MTANQPDTEISSIVLNDQSNRTYDYMGVFASVALVNFLALTIAWLIYVDNFTFPKDWRLFWDTSNLFASGAYGKIYPGVSQGLPFVYPPYFPLFVYPLSFLAKQSAYIFLIIFDIVLMILSFFLLWRITSIKFSKLVKLFIISLSSASWLVLLPLGHISVLFLFLICSSLWLQLLNRRLESGLVLSLLMLKPNIGIIFPVLFALRRDYKTLAGWGTGFGILCVLPFFFSKYLWRDYLTATLNVGDIISQIPPWKHHTLHAFFRSCLLPDHTALVFPLWLIFCGSLTLLCLYVWSFTRARGDCLPKLYSVAVLTIVVCNPYLHHYDAIIVVLPAVVFFSDPIRYSSKSARLTIVVSLFLAYILQQISVFYMQRGLSLVSIPLMIFLIAELWELMALKRLEQKI